MKSGSGERGYVHLNVCTRSLLVTLSIRLHPLISGDLKQSISSHFWVLVLNISRYLDLRGISNGRGPVIWPANYGPAERDKVYETFSLSGWPGRSGHDAPMIALDALLGSGSDWEELMSRAAFHGGEWLN